MDGSYFRNHWNSFAPSRYHTPGVREVPVHRPVSPSPKVVRIPVQFIGAERRRSDSAVKIQKAFRGFLVRKSVKKVAAVKREVDEIERRISEKELAELMRREAKERLKVNETLMALLFRLDSVKGVDAGVRDFRKAVIKKAIALQERVDAVAVAVATSAVSDGDDDETLGHEDGENPQNDETLEFQFVGAEDLDENQDLQSPGCKIPGKTESTVDEEMMNVNDNNVCEYTDEEGGGGSGSESESELLLSNDGRGSVEGLKGENEEKKRSRELMEKMVEENEKMMGMMVELFERNEIQTRLLSSLSQRVEQLERALVCEKLRRRKKRHAAAAPASPGCNNNARKL